MSPLPPSELRPCLMWQSKNPTQTMTQGFNEMTSLLKCGVPCFAAIDGYTEEE